ncbi:hypothetical protein [Phenylobacterium sp.]|uniref:hypothetical protein n=1 Tax=Phenylobacterium sp. TaxID=1871053 RepID=UPI0035B32F49
MPLSPQNEALIQRELGPLALPGTAAGGLPVGVISLNLDGLDQLLDAAREEGFSAALQASRPPWTIGAIEVEPGHVFNIKVGYADGPTTTPLPAGGGGSGRYDQQSRGGGGWGTSGADPGDDAGAASGSSPPFPGGAGSGGGARGAE